MLFIIPKLARKSRKNGSEARFLTLTVMLSETKHLVFIEILHFVQNDDFFNLCDQRKSLVRDNQGFFDEYVSGKTE